MIRVARNFSIRSSPSIIGIQTLVTRPTSHTRLPDGGWWSTFRTGRSCHYR